MTEYDLIAIAKRFRKMEDAVFYARRRTGEAGAVARDRMDRAIEACRDDMVRMQEEIRKAAK